MTDRGDFTGSKLPPLEPGSELGDYRIERFLAAGAMGAVYVAEQLSLSRLVAVKVFSRQLVPDADSRAQFLQEIRLTAALDHPNIATAYGAGEVGDLAYLAMKFVDGRDLSELLAEYPRVDERDALDLVAGVARALGYAWDQQRLVHRDVKPSNIKLDQRAVPHLLDLGIATSAEHLCHLDRDGFVLGTPHYMSPEQARGTDELDFRTDVYSLGATLYQMVTGETPHPDDDPEAVLKSVREVEILPASERNPKVGAAMNDLVMHMLAYEPGARPSSWEAVLEEIAVTRLARDESNTTRRIRRSTGGLKLSLETGEVAAPPKRTRVPTLAVGVVCAGLVMGGAYALLSDDSPSETTDSEVVEDADEPPVSLPPDAPPEVDRIGVILATAPTTPQGHAQALRDLRKIMDEPLAADEKQAAEEAIRQLEREEKRARATVAGLGRRLESLATSGKRREAQSVLASYSGPHAAWVAEANAQLTAAIEQGARRHEQRAREKAATRDRELRKTADALANGRFADARAGAKRLRKLGLEKESLDAINRLANVDLDLARTFEADVGTYLDFAYEDRTMRLKVLGVEGASVRVGRDDPALGTVERRLTYKELPAVMRAQRLARLPGPGTQALILGLFEQETRAQSVAKLGKMDDMFIKLVVASVQGG